MFKLLKDRKEAGQLLAKKLTEYKNQLDAIVLALPRGGVPVAFQIAQALDLPLDVFVVRKLGVPGQEELAMGAIASGGVTVYNEEIVRMMAISSELIAAVKTDEQAILNYREKLFRDDRPPPDIKNKIVILVDDGVATGATIRAAIKALKKLQCKKIIVAVPIAPPDTYEQLKREVDEVICLEMPYPFYAIGSWYENFNQTLDEEVRELLSKAEKFGKKPESKDG